MYANLPKQLKEDAHFVLWKYEVRNGKKTKVPYQTNGFKANPSDIRTFTTFKNVTDEVMNYDGIGIGAFNNFAMIDIDHCIENGKLSELANDIIDLLKSYTEISPSGNGIRIVFKTTKTYDKTKYYINNSKIGLEVYVSGVTKKFCTITGNSANNLDVCERTQELGILLDKYMLRPMPQKSINTTTAISYLTDESVISKALSSKQGSKFERLWNGEIPTDKTHSDADMSLTTILAFWCGGDITQMDRLFRQSSLMRDKWDRPQSGSTYGQITLQKAISTTTEYYKPHSINSAESDFEQDFEQDFDPANNERYSWNDSGSGRLFADIYKDIARFVPERKKWYVYDETRWIPDVGNLKTMELAKELGDKLMRYALTITDEHKRKGYIEYCAKWQSRNKRSTYISDAESVYPIAMAEFDKDLYLLNCLNGTINLKTKQFHKHNPDDKLTKIANANYIKDVKSNRFSQFVDEVMSGDTEKAKFLQKTLGYGLTGDTRYECMFIYHGATTRNGKGTLMESVLNVMGDYGLSVRPETISAKQNSNSQTPTEDIARLSGIRFANISEPRRGLVLNEAQIKSMTGNDTLNARFLHENSFDFKPQFKLYVNTNYLPVITDMTLFTSGRIILIPFERHFEESEQDPTLKYEFAKDEVKSAILNWLIDGYTSLSSNGFSQPSSVVNAIKSYHQESDKIQLFADECLKEKADAEVKTSNVYNSYRMWCAENGSFPENSRNFNQALRNIGNVTRKRPKLGGEKTTLLTGFVLCCNDFL